MYYVNIVLLYHLYVEPKKKTELMDTENRLAVARGRE